jgi:integrase
MSLFKRNKTWWIDITTPSGERVRQSARTQSRTSAKELHDEINAKAWRVQNLGEKPSHTWDDAGLKWLQDKSGKRTHAEDKKKLAWLQQFLRGRILSEISEDDIQQIVDAKLVECVPATVNRYLALIRSIFRRAMRNWKWLNSMPSINLLPEASRRIRWLRADQARDLITELPDHLKSMVLFSLATGVRQSNVLSLEWAQIDMRSRLVHYTPEQMKNAETFTVALSEMAVQVLEQQRGKHPVCVFTYCGAPVSNANTRAWRSALLRAGIHDFRWHDLRHTWASWHVQNGTPIFSLQELGGWKSQAMVRRYAHLSQDHLRKHAEVVGRLVHDTIAAQGV